MKNTLPLLILLFTSGCRILHRAGPKDPPQKTVSQDTVKASSEWTDISGQDTIKDPPRQNALASLFAVRKDPFAMGVSVLYQTSSAACVGLSARLPRSLLGVSLSFQSGGDGKFVTERKSNYGLTVKNTGSYFDALNISYHYKLINRLYLGGEYTIGWIKDYTSYLDARFTGGGYWMIDRTRTVSAFGASAIVPVNQWFNIQAGYNSLTGIGIGGMILIRGPQNIN